MSGLLLIGALSTACGGAASDQPPRRSSAQQERPADESATGLAEPRVASPERAGETTTALAAFNERVNRYAEIHKDLAKGSAKQRPTDDPARIHDAKATLAAKVRAARPDAKQGDLFIPPVHPVFRRLLAPELKGTDGRDTKAVLADDAPAPGAVPFRVNATYPEAQPLPTVPANILATLPPLPPPLEYRIVGRHLLLVDTAAGLIVDYIPNAIAR